MVVGHYNRRGIADDGRAEEFTRCHQDGVEGPDAREVESGRPGAGC